MLHLPLVHRASTIWQSSFLASSTAISFARSTHDSPDVCVMMYVCISASFWYVSTSVCLSDVCLHHCVFLMYVCITACVWWCMSASVCLSNVFLHQCVSLMHVYITVCHDSPDVCLHHCVFLMYVCITVCMWCASASLYMCDDLCLHQCVSLMYVCITVCHNSPDVCLHHCNVCVNQCAYLMYVWVCVSIVCVFIRWTMPSPERQATGLSTLTLLIVSYAGYFDNWLDNDRHAAYHLAQ